MVRLQDIADKAGVARGTVSNVMNGNERKARISARTSERIRAIAAEMGYCRNELARAVITGHNNVIAFVSWMTGTVEYIGKIMSGILREIDKEGYSLKIHTIEKDTSITVRRIVEQRTAGVIVYGDTEESLLIRRQILERDIPCAAVNASNDQGVAVFSDDVGGTAQAVRHLAEFGHRRIAIFSSARRALYSISRENGFIAGMERFASVDAADCRIVRTREGFGSNNSTYEKILREPLDQRPTAIVSSDYIAFEVMQTAYKFGVRIPDELSIVGFADLDMAKRAVVPLTTVAQPFELMGSKTAEMLLDAIRAHRNGGEKVIGNVKLPTKLVVRKSTAPPCR